MIWHEGERTTVVGGIISAVLSLWFFIVLTSVSMDFSMPRHISIHHLFT